MTLEHGNYILWGPSNKMRIFIYHSHIQARFGNLGGILIPTLCSRTIFHPKNIPQNYSLKLRFTTTLSLNISTLFPRFLLFIPALFIIRTNVSFFLSSKLLLMKVRQWRPILDAKYRMEHNHAVE